MKLIVMIPAYNEEKTISAVIQRIPKKIPEIETIKIVLLNDGSTDRTVEEALKTGVDHIVNSYRNVGLAAIFRRGLKFCCQQLADIVVNIDADAQYDPTEIPNVIKPVLEKRADMVIGDRQIHTLRFMPIGNLYGNMIGSWALNKLTHCQIHDVSSGFRSFSRECILHLNIFSTHTYTHETIVQTTYKGFVIEEVPVTFRPRLHGKSRLTHDLLGHIFSSTKSIIRVVLSYRALKFFSTISIIFFLLSLVPGFRFLYFYILGKGMGHIQSLILMVILIFISLTSLIVGILGDITNRQQILSEEILYYVRKNF